MTNVFCIRHPKYDPKERPVLSCVYCCQVFIAEIRKENAKKADREASKVEGWSNPFASPDFTPKGREIKELSEKLSQIEKTVNNIKKGE